MPCRLNVNVRTASYILYHKGYSKVRGAARARDVLASNATISLAPHYIRKMGISNHRKELLICQNDLRATLLLVE
jgi:hypothetical protein